MTLCAWGMPAPRRSPPTAPLTPLTHAHAHAHAHPCRYLNLVNQDSGDAYEWYVCGQDTFWNPGPAMYGPSPSWSAAGFAPLYNSTFNPATAGSITITLADNSGVDSSGKATNLLPGGFWYGSAFNNADGNPPPPANFAADPNAFGSTVPLDATQVPVPITPSINYVATLSVYRRTFSVSASSNFIKMLPPNPHPTATEPT